MKILGVDPGLERIGYGLVRRVGSKLEPLEYGLIESPRIAIPDRLAYIRREFLEVLNRAAPDIVATERLVFAANRTTAMDVSKALGVLLLTVGEAGIPWVEYAPPEIKLAVVGNGAAEKKQVQFMVGKLLSLNPVPKPDDVADALGIAICCAFRAPVAGRLG